ncbi:MAG: hypothetical protein ACJ79E_20940 [Anaeromyxobacteraceae bacterium]
MSRFLPVMSAAALAACACAGHGSAAAGAQASGAPRPVAPSEATEPGSCPMALPFTTATLTQTERGGAITFTTSDDQVEELRRRVSRLAEAHNAGHPSRASVEAVEHGARLLLSAEDPARADGLREAIFAGAEYMRRQGCEMRAEAAL